MYIIIMYIYIPLKLLADDDGVIRDVNGVLILSQTLNITVILLVTLDL